MQSISDLVSTVIWSLKEWDKIGFHVTIRGVLQNKIIITINYVLPNVKRWLYNRCLKMPLDKMKTVQSLRDVP